MNEPSVGPGRRHVGRHQVSLRAAVIVGALTMLAATRMAAVEPVPLLEVTVIVLAALCAALPDTHLGLAVVVLAAANWLATVDDTTTPWAAGMGVGLIVFHASCAAATIAPPSASLRADTVRRWSTRTVVAATPVVPVWLGVTAVARLDIGPGPTTAAMGLFVVAVGALWARHGRWWIGPQRGRTDSLAQR